MIWIELKFETYKELTVDLIRKTSYQVFWPERRNYLIAYPWLAHLIKNQNNMFRLSIQCLLISFHPWSLDQKCFKLGKDFRFQR
jgi:hypothetical protein